MDSIKERFFRQYNADVPTMFTREDALLLQKQAKSVALHRAAEEELAAEKRHLAQLCALKKYARTKIARDAEKGRQWSKIVHDHVEKRACRDVAIDLAQVFPHVRYYETENDYCDIQCNVEVQLFE